MKPELKQPLADYLLALADDELILGHRDSEWAGHAPILEEDIAFANIALDELGHAKIWYALLAEVQGENPETYPDQLVYFRDGPAWRSAQMVELPKGDWAFSIVRQYLFDTAEVLRLQHLSGSQYQPLAEAAQKTGREEVYHVRHTQAWVTRLGLGTAESNRRMQNALDELWPYAHQLFASIPGEAELLEAGYIPDRKSLQAEWRKMVVAHLTAANLQIPAKDSPPVASRSIHTNYMLDILTNLQMVARQYPQAEW